MTITDLLDLSKAKFLVAPWEHSLTSHVMLPTGRDDAPYTRRLGFKRVCDDHEYFSRPDDVAKMTATQFIELRNRCPGCELTVKRVMGMIEPDPELVPIVKGVPLHGSMRRFEMVRHVDSSGVSGTGLVCWGVQYPDGRVSTRWAQSEFGRQTSAWDCIDDVVSVHGHKGNTELRWLDPE